MPLGIEIDTAMMLTNDEVDMILTDDQMDVLNQAMWGAFNDLNAHTKVLDLREAHANEIKKGGEALQAVKVTLHDEMEKTSEAMNAANAFVTFPETPHSPVVVEENEDWAGVFFEEHEAPIAEHQDSFTEYEASSTVQTVSASDQTSSPTDQTASFSKRNGLEHFDDGMPTYEDVENAAKELLTYEDFEGEPKGLNELYGEILDFDELYPQPKGPIGLLESPLSSPSISSSADVQNSVQQFVQPVHQAKQPLHQVEEKVHQVKTPHQAEQTIHQVQPTHQAQPLHAEEQTVRPIDAAHQVKEPVIHVEQPVHQMQPACSIKLPTGQLHLPMHQPQGAYQIHQPSLYLPQNHPQLKQVTKKAQDMAKKSAVASTTVTKSAPTTLLVDAQLVRASHVPQMVVAGLQDCGEPEMMDGVLAHESNERSYIVTEEQSEYGLAGLFGLTLDQVKSGMRNKKVRVRNTIIEKPKVCLP